MLTGCCLCMVKLLIGLLINSGLHGTEDFLLSFVNQQLKTERKSLMEDKNIELENRIKKLETILENIEFSGDSLNISFNKTPLNSVEISGDGANAEFRHCPIGYASTDTTDELEDLEDAADDLECRVEDIKCAAEDTKSILNDIEPKVTALLEKLKQTSID